MFVAQIENSKNEVLRLTQAESDFQVVSILGLNPPNAQINTAKVAGLDGSKYNSAKLDERNIVITLKLNGDIEKNRLRLNTYFNTKEWCKFYYKNSSRDVYIEGYIETTEYDLFTNNETMQISILCPNPYFKAMEMIVDDISKSLGNFVFPFSIQVNEPIPFSIIEIDRVTNVFNEGESETGLIIDIDIYGNVNKILIRNIDSGEEIVINHSFIENDKVTINTNKGQKAITLQRGVNKTNIFSSIGRNSKFFQLSRGDNFFSFLADDGASDELVDIVFKHYTIFRGV